METFAGVADEKAVKVVLRGVNVDIYKVLKLVKLHVSILLLGLSASHGAKRGAERHGLNGFALVAIVSKLV